MSYELTMPLKGATLEIEFDTLDELGEKLAQLDLARVEALVRETYAAGRKRAPPARKARKSATATKKAASSKAARGKKRRT